MREHWYPAYVGVGSNLDSPAEQVSSGINALNELQGTSVVLESSLYRSRPMGPEDQPDFVNAVVALVTQRSATDLLAQMQDIERSRGRKRSAERWGPRKLDLDLLAWSDLILDSDTFTLPHPGIAKRNFVLFPWRDIAPDYSIPGLGRVVEVARQVPDEPRINLLV